MLFIHQKESNKTTLTSTRSTNYNCSFIDSVHYQTENNKQRHCTVKSIWSTNFNHLHRICTESCNYTCILIFTHYMVKNVRESFFIIAIMQLEGHKVRCTKWYRNTFKDELWFLRTHPSIQRQFSVIIFWMIQLEILITICKITSL